MATTDALEKQSDPLPINEVIVALKSRCPWSLVREALKREELPVGVGWNNLIENANEKSDSAGKLCSFIKEFYQEHLLYGERYVCLYELDNALSMALRATLKQVVVPSSIFSVSYPLPLPTATLSSAPSEPTLVNVKHFPNEDIALVYCSVRSYDERQVFEYKNLSTIIQHIYSGIDRLITFRKTFFQAYDVVILRTSLNRIEISVDQPEKGSKDLNEHVLNLFGATVKNIPMLDPVYQSPMLNIFAAISGIFSTAREGIVHRLSFRTLTGSKKTETMVMSGDDLRNEKFHHGGMAAVGNEIRPYELVAKWDFPYPAGFAQLRLSASVAELSHENPQLAGCFITANDASSFLRAVNKVIKYQ